MTLAISTFYSDRIRCSVDIVGMSNLVTFLEHTEGYRRDLCRVEYGDERDLKVREFFERITPMNNIDKIGKPMMVVAGKNDPAFPVSESDQIVAALARPGLLSGTSWPKRKVTASRRSPTRTISSTPPSSSFKNFC